MARCVTCRKLICHECSTRWEGINYCISCLENRAGESSGSSDRLGVVGVVVVSVLLFWAVWRLGLTVGVWIVGLV